MPTSLVDRPTWNYRTALVPGAQALIVAMLLALPLWYTALDCGSESLTHLACWLLVVLFGWSLVSWAMLTGSWFDPYSLFLVAATAFNGGHAFLEVMNCDDRGVLDGQFTPELTLETLYLVTLGLACLHLGALVSWAIVKRLPGAEKTQATPTSVLNSLRWVGWAMLLAALPFSALVLKDSVMAVMTAGRIGLFQQDFATGVDASGGVLASFLAPGSLFLLAASKTSRFGQVVSWTVLALYAMVQLYLGGRYVATAPLVAGVWLWHRQIRPLNMYVLAGGAAAVLFLVFPLVAATRANRGADRLSSDRLAEGLSAIDNPVVASVHEIGSSMETVSYTLSLVPGTHDYEMGASYGYALLTLVPNVAWTIHPTIAHGTPSAWLIGEVDPWAASQGGGIGYSFIAEAYLNFAWPGVPIVIFLQGLAFGGLMAWAARTRGADRLALLACVACFATFYARAEAATVTRGVAWNAVVPYLAVVLLSSVVEMNRSRQAATAPMNSMPKGRLAPFARIQEQ